MASPSSPAPAYDYDTLKFCVEVTHAPGLQHLREQCIQSIRASLRAEAIDEAEHNALMDALDNPVIVAVIDRKREIARGVLEAVRKREPAVDPADAAHA